MKSQPQHSSTVCIIILLYARPPPMPQAAGPGARAARTPKPNGLAHRLTKNNICYNG
jgi:hypothetical protein